MQATYTNLSTKETRTFDASTATSTPPIDTSPDAICLPKEGDNLYDLRMTAHSIQHQLNTYFTNVMAEEKLAKTAEK
ncbi:hypothetical protein DASB73_032700 [Starmerella bacillaris]|uniref:EKC/KEOPS complex subunit GON7 n=1 Tax=Starmerella bacillaris TaxID=1247836 RepID=A0AAV5RM27_STABA|nr:hypothetical protein DASB73_032700 [Starmerella bacillaris]